MSGSGPFGVRPPRQEFQVLFDRPAASGRFQMSEKGKTRVVYQETPAGLVYGTAEKPAERFGDAQTPFAFVPLTRTGVLGLLALRETGDTLTYVEKGEIKGKKGPMIVRTQAAPRDTLVMAGRAGFSRTSCRTAWSYLFGPDGTLIAERVTQTLPDKSVDLQMSCDRFATFSGIKFPTEVGVQFNQVPRGFSLKFRVKQVTVDAPVAKSAFQTPSIDCPDNHSLRKEGPCGSRPDSPGGTSFIAASRRC